ncbi:hypothetical protein [Burkholderia sp. TSV86]|uniref:hypothetical protein n=1 Tax=Burkholderia sp. TSV86 TaxID=1385594 RepID=UPI000B1FC6C8|nr:hypothetical protein [Burkholderia sp. TSV86]
MTHPKHPDRDTPAHQHGASPPLKNQERASTRHSERHIDEMLEQTFPASDAPATGGTTRIEPSTPTNEHAPADEHEDRASSDTDARHDRASHTSSARD